MKYRVSLQYVKKLKSPMMENKKRQSIFVREIRRILDTALLEIVSAVSQERAIYRAVFNRNETKTNTSFGLRSSSHFERIALDKF